MSRLTRDGMAEPVSRHQILSREQEQGNIIFPCSACKLATKPLDYSVTFSPSNEPSSPRAGLAFPPVDVYSGICDDHTYYIHTCSAQFGPLLLDVGCTMLYRAKDMGWCLLLPRYHSRDLNFLLRYDNPGTRYTLDSPTPGKYTFST